MNTSRRSIPLSREPFGGELDDPKLAFHLRRRQLIDRDLIERIELTNYNSRPVEFTLVFRHEADFKDLFEVRGMAPLGLARCTRPRYSTARLTIFDTAVATDANTGRGYDTSARRTTSIQASPNTAFV